MRITRDIETQKGPAEWFTGDVYIGAVAATEATSTFAAAAVYFTPGARTACAKQFHHPVVGDLTLTFDMMELAADPGLNILTYSAEPGSKSADALHLLASWSATPDPADALSVEDEG